MVRTRFPALFVTAVALLLTSGCCVTRTVYPKHYDRTTDSRSTSAEGVTARIEGTDLVVRPTTVVSTHSDVEHVQRRDYNEQYYGDTAMAAEFLGLFVMDFLMSTYVCIDCMGDDDREIAAGPLGWLATALPFVTALGEYGSDRRTEGPEIVLSVSKGTASTRTTSRQSSVTVSGAGERVEFDTDADGSVRVPLYPFAAKAVAAAKDAELQVVAGDASTTVTVPFDKLVEVAGAGN